MRIDDAIDFIAPALPRSAGPPAPTWADVGAGDGTFARALVGALGASATVYAIDRDHSAMRRLSRAPREAGSGTIITRVADIADSGTWTALSLPALDGVLLANTLHFIPYPEQRGVLQRLASALTEEGRLLLIEYENRAASRWVPYPIAFEGLAAIAPRTLAPPVRVASRPSAFGGSMYLSLMGKQ